MSTEIATYTVAAIGFERTERRAMRSLVAMAGDRQPSFKLFDKSLGGCPDLILVDADSPSAIRCWNKFRRANAHLTSITPIFVGLNLADLPCPDPYVVQRPILPSHLLAALDRAVIEVHGFRPPASILDEPAVGALVVDDSPPVRVQMRGALSPIVSRVDFAESGARALEMIDTHRYSIIFLDCTLPGEDAHEICGLIKQHPLQQEAVVLTSNSFPADRVMEILAGFDDYPVKATQSAMFGDMSAELIYPAAAA